MKVKCRISRRKRKINKWIRKISKHNDEYRHKLKKIGVAYSFYGYINENGIACCPICGREMGETEQGRHYCDECREKMGDEI